MAGNRAAMRLLRLDIGGGSVRAFVSQCACVWLRACVRACVCVLTSMHQQERTEHVCMHVYIHIYDLHGLTDTDVEERGGSRERMTETARARGRQARGGGGQSERERDNPSVEEEIGPTGPKATDVDAPPVWCVCVCACVHAGASVCVRVRACVYTFACTCMHASARLDTRNTVSKVSVMYSIADSPPHNRRRQ